MSKILAHGYRVVWRRKGHKETLFTKFYSTAVDAERMAQSIFDCGDLVQYIEYRGEIK